MLQLFRFVPGQRHLQIELLRGGDTTHFRSAASFWLRAAGSCLRFAWAGPGRRAGVTCRNENLQCCSRAVVFPTPLQRTPFLSAMLIRLFILAPSAGSPGPFIS